MDGSSGLTATSPAGDVVDPSRRAAPELSILIVNYNSWAVCAECLRSLEGHGSSISFEVIVVDNDSPVRDLEAERSIEESIARLGGKLVRHDDNGGYSTGMNLGLREAHPESQWILVSNPDVHYRDGTIDELVRAMEADEEIGAATPIMWWDFKGEGLLPPNILPTLPDLLRLFHASITDRALRGYSSRRCREALRIWRPDGDVSMNMLSGACVLMRRTFIEEIGFFDERFPLYYEDTDLSRRILRAGKKIVQVESAKLIHHYNRSASTNHGEAMRRYWISRRRYYRKWEGLLGSALYHTMRVFQSSALGRWCASSNPYPDVIRLEASPDKPVLQLPKHCGDYLVEICLDWNYYLAAATFGSGDQWTPPDSLWSVFGPTEWWFRVVDLTDPKLPQLGMWTFRRLPPAQDA